MILEWLPAARRDSFYASMTTAPSRRSPGSALEKRLEEGYRASAAENIAMTKEFEATDLGGWDAY